MKHVPDTVDCKQFFSEGENQSISIEVHNSVGTSAFAATTNGKNLITFQSKSPRPKLPGRLQAIRYQGTRSVEKSLTCLESRLPIGETLLRSVPPSNSQSQTPADIFELTRPLQGPSNSMVRCFWNKENTNTQDPMKFGALGGEVPRNHQEQLSHTLIVVF